MKEFSVRKMVLCALFAALIAVCAWLSIPVPDIAFTMQTFGVLLTLGILGGKWGTVSILIYLALGAVGLPVFSMFRGGLGVLLGPTGGYLWGFLATGLLYWASEKLWKPAAMVRGLLGCYLCGCVWCMILGGSGGFWVAVTRCVLPYLIPDGIKLALALSLSGRIGKHLKY